LRLLRADQRGQGFRQTGEEMRVGIFLFALDRFPLFKHGAGVACFARAEHVRMPSD
jgi:hypothetical protein